MAAEGGKILVSAGEASGDLYTAMLVEALRRRRPGVEFFGCAGPRMRQSGVRAVVDASSLAVVGLVEVVAHIPGIRRQFLKLCRAAEAERPEAAILTDSPDFHLRLGARLHRMGIPVIYLVAPQVWAWRGGRIRQIRRNIRRLLCIFPFEEAFFRSRGVPVVYIGHPLTRMVRPTVSREEFWRKHGLVEGRPLVVLLPGSRRGEVDRHLPIVTGAAEILHAGGACSFLLAATPQLGVDAGMIRKRVDGGLIRVVEGETWDAIAHADLALAASGTVTIEAALLGTPVVTFYRVSPLSWLLGRWMVKAPFLSMVNLVAGRCVVPELIQRDATPGLLAREARRLLEDGEARRRMKRDLEEVARRLSTEQDPMERAADAVWEVLGERRAHAG